MNIVVQSSPDIQLQVTGPNSVAVAVTTGFPGQNGTDGQDGADGREVELRVSGGFIQWRYAGEATWINLISLDSLRGADGENGQPGMNGQDGLPGANGTDGREVQLRVSGGFIQWKYDSDVNWINLVSLASITGPQGPAGPNEIDGSTQTTFQGLLAGNGGDVYVPTPAEARGIIKFQRRLEFTFDGGSSALDDDDATPINAVDFAGSIVSWILLETDGTGVAVDVWRVAAGNIPTALDSIVDGNFPTGNGQASGNVSAWSETALAVGDVLVASLQSAGNANYVKLALICEEG